MRIHHQIMPCGSKAEVEGILCNFTCATKVMRKKVTALPLFRVCTTIGSKKWYHMM